MAALPVGMQLVSALDDAELKALSPVGAAPAAASEHVRRALQLPLESDDVDVDMDIDVDVFRPSAMLDAQLSGVFGAESGELYFGSSFQPGKWHEVAKSGNGNGNSTSDGIFHLHFHFLTCKRGQKCVVDIFVGLFS
jgi:hypothetical protein